MPRIFLSPSTQEWNLYVNGGNEEQYMNYLADRLEPFLRANGITFTRNDPARNVQGAISDSNRNYYDMHLALHTNAAGAANAGQVRGIDIYYAPGDEQGRRLANIMVNHLRMIYPLPDRVRALSTTTLGELTQTRAPAVLAELGFHDNIEDAEWIKANLNNMAKSITLSLTEYFGLPYVTPGAVRSGIVATDGSRLNLRSRPNTQSEILTVMPNGSRVNVYGEINGWYVVSFNSLTGYAYKDFIVIT